MWGTLTISVCTQWLGLFWIQGGWWSPQPSHPTGRDRWRVEVHQHRTKCHAYWYTNYIWDSSTLVKQMKTTYVVYIGWDELTTTVLYKQNTMFTVNCQVWITSCQNIINISVNVLNQTASWSLTMSINEVKMLWMELEWFELVGALINWCTKLIDIDNTYLTYLNVHIWITNNCIKLYSRW